MKFYILKRLVEPEYDTYNGCVVLAKNEVHARKIAARESSVCFANTENYNVNLVSRTGKARVIIEDFNAG